jgi:ATP-dependent helicase/nuclease subunit B
MVPVTPSPESRSHSVLGPFRRLEEELWREIRELRNGPLAPLTVVAPTSRLVRRLKREAALAFPQGLLGVRFVDLFGFAYEHAGRPPLLPPLLAERILLRWRAGRTAAGPRTYDLAGALRAAIRDMKDAAIPQDPSLLIERLREAVSEEEEDAAPRIASHDIAKLGELLGALREYEAWRLRLGACDLPDVFLAAGRAFRPSGPVVVFGLYDVTQVQADFLETVSRATPTAFLVPFGDPDAWRFGAWFRQTFLPRVAPETRTVAGDEPPVPRVSSACGERGEAVACAKAVVALLDAGVPAAEIGVVARVLDPYARLIEEAFADHRIPWEGLALAPLARQPLAQAVLMLFEAERRSFARSAVLEVLLHPCFAARGDRRHWETLVEGLRITRGEDWAALARAAREGLRLRGGRGVGDDDRALEVPAEDAAALRTAFRRIAELRRPARAPWRRHAAAHLRMLSLFDRSTMAPPEREAMDGIRALVGSLAELDRLGEVVSLDEFLEAFERELDRASVARPASHGVAVLDAMAARGLAFRHLFVLGLNARIFPRFIVEEPFVSDAIRREVFRVLGHHLPVRLDGYDEERLLFDVVCRAATETLTLSYQRTDAEGRTLDPSPFLRPFFSQPVLHVPRGLRARLANDSTVTPRERSLCSPEPERWLRAFGGPADAFERGQRLLERLDVSDLSEHEGRIGPLAGFAELSPTALERYAECPFRFFAQEVLGARPAAPEDEEEADLDPRAIGTLEHLMLERLYGRLAAAGFRPASLEAEVARASREASRLFEAREMMCLDGLRASRRDLVARFVLGFAEHDLANLEGWRPAELEQRASGELGGVRFRIKADRVDLGPSGERRVVDYKRRRTVAWETALLTQAKRGSKLQAPVYFELLGAAEAVFHFVEDYTTTDPTIEEPAVRLRAAEWERERPRVEEAIRSLTASIRGGWFFIRPSEGIGGHCGSCEFAWACRKQHRGLARKAERAGGEYWRIVKSGRRS